MPLSADERIFQDAKRLYKDSALVITGQCMESYIGGNGEPCSDIYITDVIAGSESPDELIHCLNTELKQGREYLLYLSDEPQRTGADNETVFVPVGESVFEISGNNVIWYGDRVRLEQIKQNMAEYNGIITVPGDVYLHPELGMLVSGADEIFIGRAAQAEPPEAREVKSYSGNTSQVSTPRVSVTSIEVLGSIKGTLRYGDMISMACITEDVLSMVNSVSLEVESLQPNGVTLPKENAYYVFFLIDSPDSKQPYYFPVNPIQGWVTLDKDSVSPHRDNTPLLPYSTLEALLNVVKNAV